MNLGQLVDPEWVQRGSPAPAVTSPAPAAPLGRVMHSSDQRAGELFTPRTRASLHPPGFARQRVREVLAHAAKPLTVPEIFDLLLQHDLEVGQVQTAALTLWKKLEATREGIRGNYSYALTEKGRAALKSGEGT